MKGRRMRAPGVGKYRRFRRWLPGLALGACLLPTPSPGAPDWSEAATLPAAGERRNILNLDDTQLQDHRLNGLRHALHYPVSSTGLLMPYRPIERLLESPMHAAFGRALGELIGWPLTVNSLSEHFAWMGLSPYPANPQSGRYALPPATGGPDAFPMGASLMETARGPAVTLSCATCHTANFFGKAVPGLNNRRLRASQVIVRLKSILPYMSEPAFAAGAEADAGERALYKAFRERLDAIGAVAPQAPGLDTSLAQVALSLSRRDNDPMATRSPAHQRQPRPTPLAEQPADSKPAVWWSMKYKTRWLSDGSVVSGNPILTNLLWNEIGRGSDLPRFRRWLEENPVVIRELTAAVFATEAPRWADFLPVDQIDIAAARRGEALFEAGCSGCHGRYRKAWSGKDAAQLRAEQRIQTVEVVYHWRTPVVDVGTDPSRYRAMETLAPSLNRLDISKWMKTRIVPQQGYVPPPLEGLFTRYPYLHNNSVPNLCALLSPPAQRPRVFYQGPADNPATDYDFDCVGYPTGKSVPAEWRKPQWRVDTRLPGLSAQGHYAMMLRGDGSEKYSPAQKRDLIEYLKTL